MSQGNPNKPDKIKPSEVQAFRYTGDHEALMQWLWRQYPGLPPAVEFTEGDWFVNRNGSLSVERAEPWRRGTGTGTGGTT